MSLAGLLLGLASLSLAILLVLFAEHRTVTLLFALFNAAAGGYNLRGTLDELWAERDKGKL